MADLDPGFFLEKGYITINAFLKQQHLPPLSTPTLAYTAMTPLPLEEITTEQFNLAVGVLGNIFHPDAAEILYQLMQFEDEQIDNIQSALSFALYRHSTEIFRIRIREAFIREKDIITKLNLLYYLKELVDQDIADAIFNESQKMDDLDFKTQCLKALAEMQDDRALIIAEELWQIDDFRDIDGEYFEDAILPLENLQSPLLTSLLEKWLLETDNELLLDRLLYVMVQNDFGEDLSMISPYLEHEDEEIRNLALMVIMSRGGVKALPYLEERLFDPLVSEEHRRAILNFISENQLDAFEPVFIKILESVNYEDEPAWYIHAWAEYTAFHARAGYPHEQIVERTILPRFLQAVEKVAERDDAVIEYWLGAFMGCPVDLKNAAWDKIESIYFDLSDSFKLKILQIIGSNPDRRFSGWILSAMKSDNNEIREYCAEIMVDINIREAMNLREKHSKVVKELFRRSIRNETLFYEGYYIDGYGSRLKYDFNGTIPVRVITSPKQPISSKSYEELHKMDILHLSDLHFRDPDKAEVLYNQLAEDLKRNLHCSELEAIVLTGDITNAATRKEYDSAGLFLERLTGEFTVSKDRLIIVPGNHDVDWSITKKYPSRACKTPDENAEVDQSDVLDAPGCHDKFDHFRKFYKAMTSRVYPVDYKNQYTLHAFSGLLILGLNSAWKLDHRFTARAEINPISINRALTEIRKADFESRLKIATWHHPLVSPYEDRLSDHDFLEQLANAGFKIALHGHIHRAESSLYRYDMSMSGRKMEIVGAGTFGAPTRELFPGYPWQYNLLRIQKNRLIVETRRREKENGAWKPDARWGMGRGKDPTARYMIKL